jgi:hypothetical protein
MPFHFQLWQLLLVSLAGWMNREQQQVIDYLRTENAILREKLGRKRILLSDDQRRRLAGGERQNPGPEGTDGDRLGVHSEHDPSLASGIGRQEMGFFQPAKRRWQTAHPAGDRRFDSAIREGKPDVGL